MLKKFPGPLHPVSSDKNENSESLKNDSKWDYSILPWSNYFDHSESVQIGTSGNVFQIYQAGCTGPYVILLHGGGHTALTWSLTAEKLKTNCRVVAIDFRGHGNTYTEDDTDLSATTLVNDTINILKRVLPQEQNEESKELTVLVGHSMGGAIAVRIAATKQLTSLAAIMVIDVVEGTAISSLDHMHSILAKRPKKFSSTTEAIKWSLKTGSIKNMESARVSIPSQLKKTSSTTDDEVFEWRTNLQASCQYWKEWFTDLSEMFLQLKVQKVLLLAGTDRLDTALTRGQMQGKFQLQLMYGCGHIIQEDNPEKTAEAILSLCSRLAPFSNFSREQENLEVKLKRARSMMPQNTIPKSKENKD